MTLRYAQICLPGQLQTNYKYDSDGNLIHLAHQYASDSDIIETIDYQRDENNKRAQEIYSRGDSNYFRKNLRYDNLGRLIESDKDSWQGVDGTRSSDYITYTYDANGNQLSSSEVKGHALQAVFSKETRSYNDLNQLTGINNSSSSYNGLDLKTDEAGNGYRYNHAHKLIGFHRAGDQLHTLTSQMAYGPDGARATKSGYDKNGKAITFNYMFNGKQLFVTKTDEISEKGNAIHNHIVYLLGANNAREARILIQAKAGQSPQVRVSFYGADVHGSIISNVSLNEQGKPTAHYHSYDDYGKPSADEKFTNGALSDDFDPYRGAGEYVEQESDGILQYTPARELNLTRHQFNTIDSLVMPNRYGYCGGDPVNLTDPSGNSAQKDSAINFVLGAGVQLFLNVVFMSINAPGLALLGGIGGNFLTDYLVDKDNKAGLKFAFTMDGYSALVGTAMGFLEGGLSSFFSYRTACSPAAMKNNVKCAGARGYLHQIISGSYLDVAGSRNVRRLAGYGLGRLAIATVHGLVAQTINRIIAEKLALEHSPEMRKLRRTGTISLYINWGSIAAAFMGAATAIISASMARGVSSEIIQRHLNGRNNAQARETTNWGCALLKRFFVPDEVRPPWQNTDKNYTRPNKVS